MVVPRGRAPRNRGAPVDDGIYLTSTETGESRLLISLKEIVDVVEPQLNLRRYWWGSFYAFHVKWNPQGDRLMLVLRWIRGLGRYKQRKYHVITMRLDGSDVRMAISAEQWRRRGHHPNWCPDGRSITMNLTIPGDGMRFIRVGYDGSGLSVLGRPRIGSGHPTLHPDGRHIVTDAYASEASAFGDGTVPIRLIDVERGEETTLIRIRTAPPGGNPVGTLRVDPHPAWDRSSRYIAFNACPAGTRRVYVADLTKAVHADGRGPNASVQ